MRTGRLIGLVVNYKAARAIQVYLAVRLDANSPALFPNRYGKPISNRSVEKAFKKYAREAVLHGRMLRACEPPTSSSI